MVSSLYTLFYIILIIDRYCDNGTEFKGEVLVLAALNGTPIINGRAHHPETQGAIEKANGIFKARLFACQAEAGVGLSDWVRFLPEIALCVNTVRPSSLPAYITPFDVWFGRGPHWLIERTIGNRPIIIDSDDEDTRGDVDDEDARDDADNEDDSDDNSDDEYPETDDEAEEYILTAIEQRIKANNAIVAEKMVRKSKKQAVVFKDGALVTLAIPAKIRLSLEPKRLLCRIIQCVRGRYTLTFKFGRIKGSWTASELNGIDTPESGRDIPSYWPDNGPTTPLTQAVQLSNYRGTVPSMRKPNRDVTAERTCWFHFT
jgi:hypothetical protein